MKTDETSDAVTTIEPDEGNDSEPKQAEEAPTARTRKAAAPFQVEVWAINTTDEETGDTIIDTDTTGTDPEGFWYPVSVPESWVAPVVSEKTKNSREPSPEDIVKRIAQDVQDGSIPAGKYRLFRVSREFSITSEVTRKVSIT